MGQLTKPGRSDEPANDSATATISDLQAPPRSCKPSRSEGGTDDAAFKRPQLVDLEKLKALQTQSGLKTDLVVPEDFTPQRWYKETGYYDHRRQAGQEVGLEDGIALSPPEHSPGPLPPPSVTVTEEFAPQRWYKDTDYYEHRRKAGQEVAPEEEAVFPGSAPPVILTPSSARPVPRPPPLERKPSRSEDLPDQEPEFKPVPFVSHKPARSE